MDVTTPRCRYCGATLSLARVAKLDVRGDYAYACEACALKLETGELEPDPNP